MDRIFIEELVVFAQIGVYDWEQQIKQKLVFDLEMAWDCQKAAEMDDVQYCLNYAEVSQFILDYVQAKPFLLIERVAYEVAAITTTFWYFMATPQIKQTQSGCSSK
mgnify:CR=1 FL=1